ncbi:MAG: RluA family pseudouridine synthase [Gammaproteobacteria bacterium]|nr:RluA family pseudouridine synthase [Gammaproteobacteria bacterium]
MSTNNPEKSSTVKMLEVTSAQVNQRIDNFLLRLLKSIPRTRIYRIIRKGEVRINKKRIKPDYKLKVGDIVRIPPLRMEPTGNVLPVISSHHMRQLESAILFENKHMMVIDKPAGLAVHSGSGVVFGVIDIMRKLREDTDIELVHRLDRDTSGCLLLAKHRQSLLALQKMVRENTLAKVYTAIVKGCWPSSVVKVDHRLKKMHMTNGERRVYVDPAGQKAQTRIIDIQAGENYSRLNIQLITGRTHQIRVHCQAEGHEIAGDSKYGDRGFNRDMKKQGCNRLMLHASRLELVKSEYNDEVVINAPIPEKFTLFDPDFATGTKS